MVLYLQEYGVIIILLSLSMGHALDHDFHVHGIVPSLAFLIDVPESNSDSFRSHAFVTNKDKVSSHHMLWDMQLN